MYNSGRVRFKDNTVAKMSIFSSDTNINQLNI